MINVERLWGGHSAALARRRVVVSRRVMALWCRRRHNVSHGCRVLPGVYALEPVAMKKGSFPLVEVVQRHCGIEVAMRGCARKPLS